MNDFDKRIEELNQEIEDTKKEVNALNERIKNIREEVSEQIKLKNKEKMENRKCYFCGSKDYYAKGLCRNCYNRKRKSGTVEYKQKIVREAKEKKQKPMWYDRLYKDVFGENVFNDGYCKPEDFLDSISCVYNTLNPKEQEAMKMRYEGEMTFLEIGDWFDVSRERARQIIGKSLRKLKHPMRKEILQFGKMKVEEERKKKEEEAKRIADEVRKEEERRLKEMEKDGTASVQRYGLSVRAINVLGRAGLFTKGDVVEFVCNGGNVARIRNCGVKTFSEIYTKLKLHDILKQHERLEELM